MYPKSLNQLFSLTIDSLVLPHVRSQSHHGQRVLPPIHRTQLRPMRRHLRVLLHGINIRHDGDDGNGVGPASIVKELLAQGEPASDSTVGSEAKSSDAAGAQQDPCPRSLGKGEVTRVDGSGRECKIQLTDRS